MNKPEITTNDLPMKSLQECGGYAFPQHVADLGGLATNSHDFGPGMGGITVRDLFAAHVLPAVYAEHVRNGVELQASIAAEAYEIADAMLAERAI